MNKRYLFFRLALVGMAIFCLSPLYAQDTTVVQTFTWESTNRADYFTFPDDPGKTYRKILMRYNMRCHDAAVGNGDVGCREWDYSCNTFLTDPERTDSSIAAHPSHLISNFSGTSFAYTSQPTFTYYQYDQYDVSYSNVIQEALFEISDLNAPAASLEGDAPTGKRQFLFLASELTTAGLDAGPITGMAWQLVQPGQTLPYLRIRLKATDQTTLDAAAPQLDGFTEVYFKNTAFAGTDWQYLPFYQDFNWDGASNLLVEYSFSGAGPTNENFATFHQVGFEAGLQSAQPDHYLEFAGSGYVDAPADALGAISEEITISLWSFGNPNVLPVNNSVFEGGDEAGNRQVNVHLPWSNGRVYWDCGATGGSYDRIEKDAAPENYEGRWNHWAFTKNAATGSMKIFLNGQLWHSGSGKTRTMDLANLKIGANRTGGNPYFGGVHEVRVWKKELDQATIEAWMHLPITPDHPHYVDLVAYYPFDEGMGDTTADQSAAGLEAPIVFQPAWRQVRGIDHFQHFQTTNLRPNTRFVRGQYGSVDQQTITVLDSLPNAPNAVIAFGLAGTDLVALDTSYLYASGPMPILDASGATVGTVDFPAEATIEVGSLTYYSKRAAKFELLSLVTPYGNGLDLGEAGKTFTFDVTDYAPLLKGEKYLSIELGGQFQEELDIQFLFIEGTPEREVLEIQNIWPFARGYYGPIQDDAIFEERAVTLDPEASQYKIRASITGHGQNGEFVPREHYFNVNGDNQEFQFQVWKACGENPIYPQGGTWLFDRAGWCPGMATDIHEFDISFYVDPTQPVLIDYGVNGPFMTEANYLVSSQLITSGPANFTLDASLEAIIAPSKRVEFERFNPMCNTPQVLVRNSGGTTINTVTIDYRVVGGIQLSHTHTGIIYPGEYETIQLPVPFTGFWYTDQTDLVFEATVRKPNGGQDQYLANNTMTSPFELPRLLPPDTELFLKLKTNNRAVENYYEITDSEGNVVLSRYNMANNTTYDDAIDLPPGCYTLFVEDTGDDGLSYWYWDIVDPSVGSGFVYLREDINSISFPVEFFESEFGGSIRYDFVIGAITSTAEVADPRRFSIFPNPASDQIQIELLGFEAADVQVELLDLTGRVLQARTIENAFDGQQIQMELQGLASGLYFARVRHASKTWVRAVVRE